MNVLSLFDGMSCGQIALNRAGIHYSNYFASEIDKDAIYITKKNYPETKHIGDVLSVKAIDLPKIDLLIGGSPCQGFSTAGKGLNFEDPRSKLFFEFVRILNEIRQINPNVKFLLENVGMKKEYQHIITQYLGVAPKAISSLYFVPQQRDRLYWANFTIPTLQQITYNVSDFISTDAGFPSSCGIDRVFKRKNVFNTLTATYYKGIRGCSRPAISLREGFLDTDRQAHRALTPSECEKLQSVPIGYTEGVSKTQRYKMLGNGWTVDVIAHIFKGLNETS